MARSVLSRYLNPDVLNRLVGRRIDPRGLVLGNLAGSHKSPLSGFAVEFAGHREYAWGDDPKHIDWRLYFTRDMLFVKQYEMETNFVCHCMLDASASMRYGDGPQQKLAYASQMVASLGHAIVHQGDKISLAAFDEKVLGTVTPNNSMAQIIRMAELLDGLSPVNKTQMADCLGELCGRTKRREIVMIFSDFFTDLDALEPVLAADALPLARGRVVPDHAPRRTCVRIRSHDEVRRPGGRRRTAGQSRGRPSPVSQGGGDLQRPPGQRFASGTASNACWSIPAATWAKC